MATFCTHDFDDGVVVVASGGVNGDAGGLVDDNHVVVFVDDANGLGGYGGFVAMESVGDYVAVFDDGVDGGWFAIENYAAPLYGIFLDYISRGLDYLRGKR